MLGGMDGFCRDGLQAEHVDAGACVDVFQLHRQQGPQPVRRGGWAGETHLNDLHPMVTAKRLQAHAPRAMSLFTQSGFERGQQPVKPGQHIVFQANGFWEGEATGEMQRRTGRGDRLRCGPHSLIQAENEIFAKPARQRGTGLANQVLNTAQAKAGQLGDGACGQAQCCNGQGGEIGTGLAWWGDGADPTRGLGGW